MTRLRWSAMRPMGEWNAEAVLDFSCLLVGVNWIHYPQFAVFLHVGPVLLGAWHRVEAP